MLVVKPGIERNISPDKLSEYKDKGFEPAEGNKPEKKANTSKPER